jgi:hypothetical protein
VIGNTVAAVVISKSEKVIDLGIYKTIVEKQNPKTFGYEPVQNS